MLQVSNINDSSFISRSVSMPLLNIKGGSTSVKETIGKTTAGRSIQQTETPKLSLLNKIKEFFYSCFSCLKRQRKVEAVTADRVDNSLASLRSEFEKKLVEQEGKINSLQQAYGKNNQYINRNLRKILAVSDNLTDLQQRTEAKWAEIQSRVDQLEQQTHFNQAVSQKSSREMAVQTEDASTRQGSFESRSSLSSDGSHGDQALALTEGCQVLSLPALPEGSQELALMTGVEQRASLADQAPLALTAGFKQRALMAAPQLLALTAGESMVEQRLGNPYELLRQSAKFNAMVAQSAVEKLRMAWQAAVSAPAVPRSAKSPAEKLAAVQVSAKKVILNPSSTQEARSAVQAEVMQAQRELKISRKAANRKRRITVANQLKKN